MSNPLYDLETRAEWRAVRSYSKAYAEALKRSCPEFDDVVVGED
jgi:hypothetical protein